MTVSETADIQIVSFGPTIDGTTVVSRNQNGKSQAIDHQERVIQVTASDRPIQWYVEKQTTSGIWREELVPAEAVGLSRPITIFRAARKTNLIAYDWHGDKNTFCPPMWWDLAIGSGACGLGCRSCFLMLTWRIRRDPLRHLLYDNLGDFETAVEKWLQHPRRRHQHTLGVGIDRSDSLLYEGIAPHVRRLAPLFGNAQLNTQNNRLILLTKSANTHFLDEVPPKFRRKVIVSFSLNPEPIADLWEGKWPDTLERITPSIEERLEAAKHAQELGFEVRVRVDPVLTPDGWEDLYREFVEQVSAKGVAFRYWTLGTYREKNTQLDAWRARWGLPVMEWQPQNGELEKDGTHRHISASRRIQIYGALHRTIRDMFPEALISLCKETHAVRKLVKLCNADCNCLV